MGVVALLSRYIGNSKFIPLFLNYIYYKVKSKVLFGDWCFLGLVYNPIIKNYINAKNRTSWNSGKTIERVHPFI